MKATLNTEKKFALKFGNTYLEIISLFEIEFALISHDSNDATVGCC